MKRLKGVSLFTSAGIAETYLEESGIDIVVSNELLKNRAELNQKLYPSSKVICGDIQNKKVFEKILEESGSNVDFLIATPPCQGISIAGKNRNLNTMQLDPRNYLIYSAIEFIERKKPTYILIENVPGFLKLLLPHDDKLMSIMDILKEYFEDEYDIDSAVLDSADYGVPQHRKRAIIKMNKKGKNWDWPNKNSKKVTVRDAIGHLPSLESGEKSAIPFHYARTHTPAHIKVMKNTPTGESAFSNIEFFPINKLGEKVKGYHSTYRRILWDKPAPTITMRNDAISSQRNVHPGTLLEDGTYSDARVLSPLELMLLSSLPDTWNIPADTPELLIRKCIGEAVPPLMIKQIVLGIEDLR